MEKKKERRKKRTEDYATKKDKVVSNPAFAGLIILYEQDE